MRDGVYSLVFHGWADWQVADYPDARVVVLSLEESPDLDGTALAALAYFAAWLGARGSVLRVARLKDTVHDL